MDRGPIPLSRSKRKCLTLVVGLFLFGKAEADENPFGFDSPRRDAEHVLLGFPLAAPRQKISSLDGVFCFYDGKWDLSPCAP